MIAAFDYQPRTRVIFGAGSLARLGAVASELGFERPLLVADKGVIDAGHAAAARRSLESSGIDAILWDDFECNPDTTMVERGCAFAVSANIDSLIPIGGGSAMDCAKGVNFLLTNGGRMQDYWGYGKAPRPLLPMIGVPTTTGTGSEAQSYALISDAATHVKMACGDPKVSFRVALLDPELAVSQPMSVRAAAGYDAISHAIETYVTTRRNAVSQCFSREAWRLLEASFERVLTAADDVDALAGMMLGAHLAGAAIENSMLGATHACANPLTANFGTTHGVAIAMLLPHVVRWNTAAAGPLYHELYNNGLADRLTDLAVAGSFPRSMPEAGIDQPDLARLASEAAAQWTGRFNPRPFDAAGALEVYQCVS